MVDRHTHEERHFGLVPTDQLGAADGTLGWLLSDDGSGFGEFIDPTTISGGSGILVVDVATTAAVDIAGGDLDGPTVSLDGIGGLGAGDRVLVKDGGPTAVENGIYELTAGAPIRATDSDTGAELEGSFVIVKQGDENANSLWHNTNLTTPTVGVSNITYGGIAPLAQVLRNGNDTQGQLIVGTDAGGSTGASLEVQVAVGAAGGGSILKGGDGSGGATGGAFTAFGGSGSGGGEVDAQGGNGPAGDPGGPIFLYAGSGDAGADDGAGIDLNGGDGSGNAGKVGIYTDATFGALDDVLTAQGDGTAIWAASAGGPPSGAAGGDLSGTYPNPSVVNSSHDHDATTAPGDPHTALRAVDFLVGTATAELSGEIVVGTTPGGELGGTWASPTVDATHSGSAHHDPVTVGTGLDVTGQLVELDLSEVAAGGELGGFMDAPTVDATHAGSTHIALGTSEPGVVSTTSSGTAGSGSTASKVDHSHDLGFDDASSNPLALGAVADGTEGSAARKDHVHPTTGLVTTTMEVTGGGGDVTIADTYNDLLSTTVTGLAADNQIIIELDCLVLNNSGGARTYTTAIDLDGVLCENGDGATAAASATNHSVLEVRSNVDIRASNLAYLYSRQTRYGPMAANTSTTMAGLSSIRGAWNTTTNDLTGSTIVKVKIKSSAVTATQTARVLGWRVRVI